MLRSETISQDRLLCNIQLPLNLEFKAIDGSVGLKTLAGKEGDFRVLLMAPSVSAARRVNLSSVACIPLLQSPSARAGRLLCTPPGAQHPPQSGINGEIGSSLLLSPFDLLFVI